MAASPGDGSDLLSFPPRGWVWSFGCGADFLPWHLFWHLPGSGSRGNVCSMLCHNLLGCGHLSVSCNSSPPLFPGGELAKGLTPHQTLSEIFLLQTGNYLPWTYGKADFLLENANNYTGSSGNQEFGNQTTPCSKHHFHFLLESEQAHTDHKILFTSLCFGWYSSFPQSLTNKTKVISWNFGTPVKGGTCRSCSFCCVPGTVSHGNVFLLLVLQSLCSASPKR